MKVTRCATSFAPDRQRLTLRIHRQQVSSFMLKHGRT
jgi:hypothetical protein